MRNFQKIRGLSPLVALAILLFSVFAGFVFAQASPTPEQPANRGVQNTPANTHESREAPGEDETTQFKHSASVRMLAKMTGLSLDGAYWLAAILNFAIVVGVVAWFSKKNLPAMF